MTRKKSARTGVRNPSAGSSSLPPSLAKKAAGVSLLDMANAIRFLAADAVEAAQSGHPGLPMGAADIAAVLFTRFIKFDPLHPEWPDRDRFVLSAGHGSMLLYSLLYLLGYPGMGVEEIRAFRQLGSPAAGHPEHGLAAGVEMTAGPLGQGFGAGVGMALAERHMAARFGEELVDHHTYVLASDGDLMEGVSAEAAALAGHLRLNRLIVLHDDNDITIDGRKSLADSTDIPAVFRAYGWAAEQVDGHNPAELAAALTRAKSSKQPSLISCRTQIAYGAPNLAGSEKAHGAPLGAEEVKAARKALGWKGRAFQVPRDILDAWRLAGLRNGRAKKAWEKRLAGVEEKQREEFLRVAKGTLPSSLPALFARLKKDLPASDGGKATRALSGLVLAKLAKRLPELVGGAGDLTGSTQTRSPAQTVMSAGKYGGGFIHYGVREHGMAAMMNGMALHSGVIPYGGTFLVFSDYCRAAMRIAALTGLRVIYIMTHDSIGVGEDGPTHQPVEHLAALRAIPGLRVFRPACAAEVVECWQLALEEKSAPSVLALTRQGVPVLRKTHNEENLSRRGAYILAGGDSEPDAVLVASGSEVALVMEARKLLRREGIRVRVVSAPCLELFARQEQAYRDEVLSSACPRVILEAACDSGWEHYLSGGSARKGFIGMSGFGASGKAEDLFRHFGITAQAAVERVKLLTSGKRS